jgi:uroporphyrin-III C-methyltransferase
VGCGPGAADLLTVRAARVIGRADLILHDALVPAEIVELGRSEARRVLVGRRAGEAGPDLGYLTRWMVREAASGRQVARLHGGDAGIFGRLAEELQALQQAGVDWEVVPGITASLAAGAALGTALTRRGVASSVLLAAGTSPEAIATAARSTACTLALYMAGRRAPQVAATLLGAGRPASTPVAVVWDASRVSQQSLVTTLGELETVSQKWSLPGAAVLLVGEVLEKQKEKQRGRHNPRSVRGGVPGNVDRCEPAALRHASRRAAGGAAR